MDQDKRRKAIAEEIVTTEETYVEALGEVLKRIIQPLREQANTPDMILSLAEVVDVFANFEVICNCHSNLLKALRERLNSWENEPNMGDVFLEKTAFMKLYTHYINNYEKSLATLKMYKANKERFKKFISDFELENSTVEDARLRLQLESFLIMPVQRIPRYVLLLRDLSKHTPEGHDDFLPINTALDEMEQLARKINNSKLQKDNKEKLIVLQDTLLNCPFNLLDEPNRVFLKEGSLMQIKGGSRLGADKSLQLVLFNDAILVVRELHSKYKFKAWIPLTTAHVEIVTITGSTRNSSEDLSNNAMSHPPPLVHQKSSPLLTYQSASKSPRQTTKKVHHSTISHPHHVHTMSLPHPSLSLNGSLNTGPSSPQLGVQKKSFSQHSIDLDSLTHPKVLSLKSPKGSYQFYAKMDREAELWFQDVSGAIENAMQGLVGQNQEKNIEANLKLLKNLLVFENNYLDKLNHLQKEFIKPLEDALKTKHPILDSESINAIFGPFNGEATFQQQHTQLLNEKIKTWNRTSTITDLYNMEWLSTYKVHVRSHQAQTEALAIVQQDPTFMNFELLHSSRKDSASQVVTLQELLGHPLKNLSSCYVVFRQILLHTTDAEDSTQLKELVNAIKLIYEEQQKSETEVSAAQAAASSPNQPKVKDYGKVRKTLKALLSGKSKRNSLPTSPKSGNNRSTITIR